MIFPSSFLFGIFAFAKALRAASLVSLISFIILLLTVLLNTASVIPETLNTSDLSALPIISNDLTSVKISFTACLCGFSSGFSTNNVTIK